MALSGTKRAPLKTVQALITKSDRYQRDSEYHRRANVSLRSELRDAQESTSNVQNARRLIQQWDTFSDTLSKVGFVAETPTDLGRSIEKLVELRDSAAASSSQATLDKQELATEKAAREAAVAKAEALSTSLEKAQIDARLLEIQLEDMKADAEANSELNNHHHECLGHEAAAELQEQLKKAREATMTAEGKLRTMKDNVHIKKCEITALYKEKNAEIAALRAELEKVAKMNGAEASTSLQQELSQTKFELATAQEAVELLATEGRAMLVEGQTLMDKYNVLSADFDALTQTARKHEERANWATFYIRGMRASFKKNSMTRVLAQ